VELIMVTEDKSAHDVVAARLGALGEQMNYLVERQRKQDELLAELGPILKEVMATATTRLDALDKQGVFAFGRELARVTERIVAGYTPEDVRELGDAIVRILDTVRAMTQPEVLAIAEQASVVLQQADAAEPIGLVGMVRASRDEEVQKGLAVMLDLLRHVGRGARAAAQREGARTPHKARPAEPAGTRRKVLGVERSGAPARKVAPAPAACGAPSPSSGEVAAVLDGVGFTADGHLADPAAWTRALGERIAAAQGVALGAAHWAIVGFARAEFEKAGASPNVRRLTQGAGVTTKDLYTLFPRAPARTVARIAGIPKPVGCI
jgi:tRNA 2-thiouridine synthesizing protein E